MPIDITEILGRAETGISVKPFICMTEEGRKVYVKTSGALKFSLIAEWIGGKLAKMMALPCADISLVSVPDELAAANRNPEWKEFRAGIGFGSYALGNGYRDLQSSDISRLPTEQLAEIYLFDYWIQNEDRLMGITNGNPNALVSSDVTEIVAIDHDNGFDSTFSKEQFDTLHLGRSGIDYWRVEAHKKAWLEKAAAVFSQLEVIWGELPEEWVYSDIDNEEPPSYTVEDFRAILTKPFDNPEAFWKGLLI